MIQGSPQPPPSNNPSPTVYRQGDIGTNWYAVLSGSLDVNVSESGDEKVQLPSLPFFHCPLLFPNPLSSSTTLQLLPLPASHS